MWHKIMDRNILFYYLNRKRVFQQWKVLTLMVRGVDCARIFSDAIFRNLLWTFRKSKRIFIVFHSVLGWSSQGGTIPPPTQATSRCPPLLGLKIKTIVLVPYICSENTHNLKMNKNVLFSSPTFYHCLNSHCQYFHH